MREAIGLSGHHSPIPAHFVPQYVCGRHKMHSLVGTLGPCKMSPRPSAVALETFLLIETKSEWSHELESCSGETQASRVQRVFPVAHDVGFIGS